MRAGSWNKKLLALAADAAENAGAEVTRIDFADFNMPVYDGDLETAHGMPEPALRLRRHLEAHDGFLLASPEYNSSIPGPLKNAIDWVSRPIAGEPTLLAFRGKVGALFGASPGSLGAVRSLIVLRAILSHLGVLVLPEQMTLPAADRAFGPDGKLLDPRRGEQVSKVASGFVRFLQRLQ
jgi:NAD(P)H-dependent FMN reductase